VNSILNNKIVLAEERKRREAKRASKIKSIIIIIIEKVCGFVGTHEHILHST
jgi:hypothetical protein